MIQGAIGRRSAEDVRMQREQINIRSWAIREQFLEYLHTLDNK